MPAVTHLIVCQELIPALGRSARRAIAKLEGDYLRLLEIDVRSAMA